MRLGAATTFAFLVACASSLGGCEAIENALRTVSEPDMAPAPVQPAPASPEAENRDQVAAREVPRPLRLVPRPPPVRYDPKALVGKDRAQLLEILGAPDGIREAPPATVWNYSSPDCTLDIFLYMEIASQEFHALAYEVKKGEAPEAEIAAEKCVGQFHASNQAKSRKTDP